MNNKINFELKENAPENYFNACIGWYLHGELEQMAGFDLAYCSIDPKSVEEGIHKVTYNNSIEATLYCWKYTSKNNNTKYLGLIVKDDDQESQQDANYKFIVKQQYI